MRCVTSAGGRRDSARALLADLMPERNDCIRGEIGMSGFLLRRVYEADRDKTLCVVLLHVCAHAGLCFILV
jgi:hypothetical protein